MTPLRILFVKPYQPSSFIGYSPLLGVLYLTSALRQRFGDRVSVGILDAKLCHLRPEDMRPDIEAADVVGVTAFTYETEAAFAVARLAKSVDPHKLVVMGGPFAHGRAPELFERCPHVDWIFDGESERTFPEAIARHMAGESPDGSIPGMHVRGSAGILSPAGNDFITDLDSIPMPAWDLVDFDAYDSRPWNGCVRGKRTATIFTSRGCPYKCAYCHDIFTKKFRWRSPENVVEEMCLLVDRYGVDEFQIADDIFNLHKPRLKRIFALFKERYPDRRFHFSFPNGLRGDILDRDVVRVLKDAGTYHVTVAVETVTERLQELITKHLDVERTREMIDYCDEQGILVKGYFMFGFPTETVREMWDTFRFAWRSRLTFAAFFTVVPVPGTPLYDLARKECPDALAILDAPSHMGVKSWYELAYGFPLRFATPLAMALFHLHPRRLHALLTRVGIRWVVLGAIRVVTLIPGSNPLEAWVGRRRRRKLLLDTPVRNRKVAAATPDVP